MKIDVQASELAKKIQRALGVVQSKVTIPVLAFVKVEVLSVNEAKISGSDLGMSMIQTVDITLKSEQAGTLLLPAKKISEIIANVPSNAVVSIDDEGGVLNIKAGKYKGKIPTVAANLFPAIEARPETQFVINKAALKSVIEKVEVAAPTKAGRHSVASILLESNATTLRAVASDGFRIAIADQAGAGGGEFSIQLPKTLLGVLKEIPGVGVQFSESETNFFFLGEKEQILIRKPTTKFPAYQKALGMVGFVTTAEIPVPMFKQAIAVVNPVTDSKNPSVFLTFGGGAEMTVSSASTEGEAEDTVDIKFQGQPNKVKLNQNFILDFLNQAEGSATVQVINETSLVKLTNGEGFTYLVMPLLPEVKEAAKQ